MDLNEIKKTLYKEKPFATFSHIRKGSAFYSTKLEIGEIITFEIPIIDMGDADFFPIMDAKLLIRWILKSN